jgi:predicted nuclease of predicted toxin-antitoxin system
MSCRLLLDEHLPPFITLSLAARGHDALTAQEAGLQSTPDDVIMEWAMAQGRVILTEDRRDFPRLVIEWNALGKNFRGVVLLNRGSFGRVRDLVRSIEQHITPDLTRLQNSLTWLPPPQ